MNIRQIPKLIAFAATAAFLICAVAQNADPSAAPPSPPEPSTPIETPAANSPEEIGEAIEAARSEIEKARVEAEKARAEAEKIRLKPLAPVDEKEDANDAAFRKGFPFNASGIHIDTGNSEDSRKTEDERILELLFPVIIVAIVFACPVFLIALILGYRVWKNRQLHKTIQTLVEKGQPIPQELLSAGGRSIGPKPPPSNKSDRRKGIIWTCVGGGLTMFFLLSDGPKGLGFIPLAIGIGYLLVAKFAPRGPDEP